MKKCTLIFTLVLCMILVFVPVTGAVLYPISAEITGSGKITAEEPVYAEGDIVTFSVKPDRGYKLDSIEVADYFNIYIETERNSDGTYSFIMPDSKVTIKVVFEATGEHVITSDIFSDVPIDAPYYEAVKFVCDNELFLGLDSTVFAPDAPMTRGMLVKILYRLDGEPDAKGENKFSDVKQGVYYYDAVIWAEENGIVSGYGDGSFGPDYEITREQAAVILWRYAGSPYVSGDLSGFSDGESISAYADKAFIWAIQNGILESRSAKLLSPCEIASRAEVAVMFWQYLK